MHHLGHLTNINSNLACIINFSSPSPPLLLPLLYSTECRKLGRRWFVVLGESGYFFTHWSHWLHWLFLDLALNWIWAFVLFPHKELVVLDKGKDCCFKIFIGVLSAVPSALIIVAIYIASYYPPWYEYAHLSILTIYLCFVLSFHGWVLDSFGPLMMDHS